MTLPTNFNPNGLSPKILIYDLDEVLQYTYESKQIASSPIQDFYLRALSLHIGINDDFGNSVLLIDDPQNELTDSSTRKASRIKRQWVIKIHMGKDADNLNLWFTGKIIDVDIIRPDTNLQQIRIVCSGWGIRLRDRLTNIKRFQAKDTDGITLDSTDTNVKVSELAKDIFSDIDHYVVPNLGTEAAITTTGVDDINIKLANLQQDYQTWANVISELATSGNATYYVDQDRVFNFKSLTATNSGFLFTNDIDSTFTQNWDVDKLGLLYKQDYMITDSTSDSGYSLLHGYGADIIKKDYEYTTANATRSSHTSWLAIPFTPTRDNIAKVALSMGKTGTPSSATDEIADFRIIGDDGSSGPNPDDLRKQTLVQKNKLDTLGASTGWFEIPFDNLEVPSREELFLVVRAFGNVTNTFVMDYQTGTGTYYTSSDGDSWSSATGKFKLRSFSAYPVQVTLEDVTARRKYGVREKAIPFRKKIQEETARRALIMASEVLCKEKRIYSKIAVSPPTDLIPVGQTCIIKDSFNSMSVLAEIVGIDLMMEARDASNVGTNVVYLSLMEHHY